MFGNLIAARAYYNHARGKTQKARGLYEKAFAQGCDKASFYGYYSVLLMRDYEYAAARDFLTKTLEWLDSDKRFKPPRKTKTKRGKERENKRYRKADRANLLLNLGLSHWKTGDLNAALDCASKPYTFYKNASVLSTYGFFLLLKGDQTGDYTLAEQINLEALDYDDKDAVILDNMGQLRFRQGRYDEAKVFFERALEKRPTQVDSVLYLAYIAHAQGDNALAIELADKALSMEFKPLGTVSREDAEAFRASLG